MNDPERIPISPIRAAILNTLKTGNKTQGELLDLTQCGSYPALNIHLKDLIDADEIEAYFSEPPSHLTYRLKPTELPRPRLLTWYRPN